MRQKHEVPFTMILDEMHYSRRIPTSRKFELEASDLIRTAHLSNLKPMARLGGPPATFCLLQRERTLATIE